MGFYWRTSTRDGIYGISGNLIRSGNFSHARYTGVRPITEMQWQIDRHWSVSAHYIYVFSGKRFARETPPFARDLSYTAIWTTFRF